MQKGLLLDRVQVKHTGIAVNQAIQFPVPVFTDAARAAFSIGDVTLLWTKGTLDLTSVKGLEKGGKLRLYEPLLWGLSRAAFRKKDEASRAEGTKAAPADFEKLAFCEAALLKVVTFAYAALHVFYLTVQQGVLLNLD